MYDRIMISRHQAINIIHPSLLGLLFVLSFFACITSIEGGSDGLAAFMSSYASRKDAARSPRYRNSVKHPIQAGLAAKDGGGGAEDRRQRMVDMRKEQEKLNDLMAKQERKAIKKYLEDQSRKEAEAVAKTRRMQNELANRGMKKEAPWSKGKGEGAAAAAPPKSKKPAFQQISLTCRTFSIDDIQEVIFEGSHLQDVPFIGLPEIAVFGRSNVGKSSLLNCLSGMNKKVAVVSKTPGRTQQINLFKVHDSNGPVAVLVDLPGYGYAKLPKALQSDIGVQVRSYLSDRPTLRLAILLMDSRREPQKSDLNMIKYFRAANVPLLVLGTKVDKLKPEEVEYNLHRLHQYFKLPDGLPLPFSSVMGLNRRAVWSAIRDACVGEYDEAGGPPALTAISKSGVGADDGREREEDEEEEDDGDEQEEIEEGDWNVWDDDNGGDE